MTDSFATVAELETTLGRTFPEEMRPQLEELLAQASDKIRSVAAPQQIWPQRTSTYTGYPVAGREELPQRPVVSVDKVERDGVGIPFTVRPGYILVSGDAPVDVTFTYGYATPPRELRRIAIALVSAALVTIQNGLGVSAAGLSSVSIDDFKLAWANGGEQSGMTLTEHTEASIRRQFGGPGVHVVDYGRDS